MENKNILICLEGLDIGGVETVVLNQASALLESGHNVIILAKKGIYSEVLEKKGATCINFEFSLDDNFNEEKANKIVQIIKENKINEVYIHQFPCILSVFPACLMTNTPYISYTHNGIGGVYEWFMNTYPVYKIAIPYYYKCARKLVVITEVLKQEIIERFNIDKDKIIVIPNSISFVEADKIRQQQINTKSNFLLITRFSKEKGNSINNAIDIYDAYLKKHKEATLTIIGDGELLGETKNYVKEKGIEESVKFLGATNEVLNKINEADIILGLGRCIIESIIMKKLAIIVGYNEPKKLITIDNIKKAEEANFSGRNLEASTLGELITQIEELTVNEIENIVEENYKYAKEHLDIKKNIYILDEQNEEKRNFSQELLEMIISIQEAYNEQLITNTKLEQDKQTIEEENKNVILNQQNVIKQKEIELTKIYNSKRWRYVDKLANLFHKRLP